MIRIVFAAAAALVVAAAAGAQDTRQDTRSENGDTFNWQGRVAPGSWLRVSNLNGAVDVVAADGDVAQVHADKEWRRGDPRAVRFEVKQEGGNVTICALWNADDTCEENGMRSHDRRNDRGDRGDRNDVSVHFTVKLPRGVKVAATTVNGGVSVSDASAEVVATSVNGKVDASTSAGSVRATTVNGDMRVRMSSLPADGDLEFTTVNGSITVEVPARFDADIDMSTVNGSLKSDFPMTVTGRIDPRHMRATIGNGGRRLRLRTVNGSVTLRKLG